MLRREGFDNEHYNDTLVGLYEERYDIRLSALPCECGREKLACCYRCDYCEALKTARRLLGE